MKPNEVIIDKIYLIRGQKIMLDRDLAELYQVETRRLNEQVRRNITRFPDDFIFEMTKEELENGSRNLRHSNLSKWALESRLYALQNKELLCYQVF